MVRYLDQQLCLLGVLFHYCAYMSQDWLTAIQELLDYCLLRLVVLTVENLLGLPANLLALKC